MGFLMIISSFGLFLGLICDLSVHIAPRMSKLFSLFKIFNMQFSKNNPNNLCYSSFLTV